MDFVLALHSHLPYVLNHGRWPHGSDWICEAAADTYLPLLEALRRLGAEETPAPVTIAQTGEPHLLPLVEYWRARRLRLRRLFHDVDGDLVGALRALEAAGRL